MMTRRFAVILAAALLAACQGGEATRPQVSAGAMPPATQSMPHRSHDIASHDDAVRADIQRRLARLPAGPYRAVTVEVWNGRVLLIGAVIKPEQRRKVEQNARAAAGSGEVLNELVLAEDAALDLFIPDRAAEAVLRRQVGLASTDAPILRVVHGVAFLLGAAASAQDAEALKEAVADGDGIKWVVNHLSAP